MKRGFDQRDRNGNSHTVWKTMVVSKQPKFEDSNETRHAGSTNECGRGQKR